MRRNTSPPSMGRRGYWSFNEAAAKCGGTPAARSGETRPPTGFNEAAAKCGGTPFSAARRQACPLGFNEAAAKCGGTLALWPERFTEMQLQ